jgi:hypothetical protein
MTRGSQYERELQLFQSGKEETSSLRRDERDILDQQLFRKYCLEQGKFSGDVQADKGAMPHL